MIHVTQHPETPCKDKDQWQEQRGFNLRWRAPLAVLLNLTLLSSVILLLSHHTAWAQVYSIKAGDIIAANYRAGGSTVVRIDPQSGDWRRVGLVNTPTDVALSTAGYLYVSEWGGLIKRVNLTNGLETIINPSTTLSQVWGLALGPSGDLYLTAGSSNRIIRLNPVTGQETLVGQGGQISVPIGIDFLDPDHLAIASWANNQVVSFSLLDQGQTVLAQGANGIDQPWGIAVFGENVYVGAHDSRLLQRIFGGGITNVATLAGAPLGIATDASGNIVVAVSGGLTGPYAIERRDPQGSLLGSYSGNYIGEITGVEISRTTVIAENQYNSQPLVPAIGLLSIDEGTVLAYSVDAADTDWPLQELSYHLIGSVPAGATLSAGGVLTWKPDESQGPATNILTVVVADDGIPSLSITQAFTVIVNEVNRPPQLDPIANKTVNQGDPITFKITAKDLDLPPQNLTFSLAPNSPSGAAITAAGDFSWTPNAGQPSGIQTFTVTVTDNGNPPLTDTRTFEVDVRGGFTLNAGDILVANYEANAVVKIDGQNGVAQTLGSFLSPTDVALAPDNAIYVSEQGGTIKRLDLGTGTISVVNSNSALSDIGGITVGPSGEIFVACATYDSVVRIDPATGAETTVTAGNLISGPYGIAMLDPGHLVVSSFYNDRIVGVALTNNTQYLVAEGNGISQPWGVTVSGGLIILVSYGSQTVQTVSNGIVTDLVVLTDAPCGIAAAANGDLAVSVNGAVPEVAWFSSGGTLITNHQSGLAGFCMGVQVASNPLNQPPGPGTNVVYRFANTGAKVRQSLVLGTDPDGDAVVFDSVAAISVQGGTVTTNRSWILYSPPAGFTNSDTFNYTVRDSRGAIANGVILVEVSTDNAPSSNSIAQNLSNGSVRLRYSGIPDTLYLIQYCTDLNTPIWQTLSSGAADSYGVFEYIDTPPPGGRPRFYRSILP